MTAISAINESKRSAGPVRGPTLRRDDVVAAGFGIVLAVAALVYATATARPVASFNDFYREAWPAYRALGQGHVIGFLRLGPAYVGSLVLRTPFALIPSLWGGGARQIYFASALPCMIAAPIFGAWLGAQRRDDGSSPNRIWIILLSALNPLVLMAAFGGHPEEVLGAVLCVSGVVQAARGKVGWAGVLIALAVINKSSALVAVPVALVVAPLDRRRLLAMIVGCVGAVMIPIVLVRTVGAGAVTAGAALGTGVGTIFNPPQLLWWFGSNSWIAAYAHDGIVLAAVLCAAIWWSRRARDSCSTVDLRSSRPYLTEALLLLALVCLLRAALDPWDNPSYNIPFIFSLLAYEVFSERPPVLTFVYSFVIFIVVPVNGLAHISNDFQAALYAAIVIPTVAWLVSRLLVRPADWSRPAVVGDSVL